jgi:hypothetical protein
MTLNEALIEIRDLDVLTPELEAIVDGVSASEEAANYCAFILTELISTFAGAAGLRLMIQSDDIRKAIMSALRMTLITGIAAGQKAEIKPAKKEATIQ